jgi:hypothetical protein
MFFSCHSAANYTLLCLAQRVWAAFFATSRRCSAVIVVKRRLPPILPPLRPYVETDFGWRQSTEHMSFNSILNFPQQAGCAELLRCACILLVDVGWGYALAAPHHEWRFRNHG